VLGEITAVCAEDLTRQICRGEKGKGLNVKSL